MAPSHHDDQLQRSPSVLEISPKFHMAFRRDYMARLRALLSPAVAQYRDGLPNDNQRV